MNQTYIYYKAKSPIERVLYDTDDTELELPEIINKHARPWTREFEMNYYDNIYRLLGKSEEWRIAKESVPAGTKPRTPAWVGRITKDIIYKRIRPTKLMAKLELYNPSDETGTRANRHHQHFTEHGLAIFRKHKEQVIKLMEDSDDWDTFYNKLDLLYPVQAKPGEQQSLDWGI